MAKIIRKRVWLSNGAKRRRKLLATLTQAQATPPAAHPPNLDFLILRGRIKHRVKAPTIPRARKRKKRAILERLWLTGRPSTVNTPLVEGILLPSAESVLTNAGLGFQITYTPSLIYPFNIVISQSPAAGVPVATGTVVQLVVSSGWATIPNEIGRQIALAITDSIALGLLPQVTFKADPTSLPGTVLKQAPAPGGKVLIGSPIFFTVAAVPPPGASRAELPSTGDIVRVVTTTD